MKERKCQSKSCGIVFTPQRMGQKVCSPPCAHELARAKREQQEAKERQAERRKDRERRDKLKTRSDYIKEAQRDFNRYVRLRDRGRPCISCGQPLGNDGCGGAYDAGHYRSVGSAPHLRFDPNNVHGQCKQCNRWGSGRAVDYRLGLIERIGLAAVEALEADQMPRKHGVEELKAIRDTYRAKARQLMENASGDS